VRERKKKLKENYHVWLDTRKKRGKKKNRTLYYPIDFGNKGQGRKRTKKIIFAAEHREKKRKKNAMHIVFKLKSRRSLSLAIFYVRMQGCTT